METFEAGFLKAKVRIQIYSCYPPPSATLCEYMLLGILVENEKRYWSKIIAGDFNLVAKKGTVER